METYHFLFEIALILLSTKLLGLLTKRIAMPQVVGALLAGLILGPAMLGVLHETSLMDQLSELGVIVQRRPGNRRCGTETLRQGGVRHRAHRCSGSAGRWLYSGLVL